MRLKFRLLHEFYAICASFDKGWKMAKYGKYLIIGSLTLLAACETTTPAAPPPPPPPPPVVKAPPPAIIPTNVGPSEYSRSLENIAGYFPRLSDEVARAASASNVSSNNAIADSLDKTTLYGRSETIDGAKAYATIAASMSSAFRQGIMDKGTPMGRARFIEQLEANPNWVVNIAGYEEAKNMASGALTTHLDIIKNNGLSLQQTSYSMQKLPMSKVVMPKEMRLKNIDANFLTPMSATGFVDSNVKVGTVATETVDNRIIAAAALYIIRADKEAMNMLRLGSGAGCATDVKIDLKMCVAASKYSFEHTYCMYEYYQEKLAQCIKNNVDDPAEIRRIRAEASAKIAREHEENSAKLAAQKAKATKKAPAKKAPPKKK